MGSVSLFSKMGKTEGGESLEESNFGCFSLASLFDIQVDMLHNW